MMSHEAMQALAPELEIKKLKKKINELETDKLNSERLNGQKIHVLLGEIKELEALVSAADELADLVLSDVTVTNMLRSFANKYRALRNAK